VSCDAESITVKQQLEKRRQEIVTLCHRGLDIGTFFAEADHVLEGTMGHDAVCWMTFDPATGLPTSHIARDSIPAEDVPRLAQNEYQEEDFNKFEFLRRQDRPAGILGEATGHEPERSTRYRELLRPNGFAHELRTTFVDGGAAWGGMALYRHEDKEDFAEEQADFAASTGTVMVEGIRKAILIGAVATDEASDAPGLLLLDGENRIDQVTPSAERWLEKIGAAPSQDVSQELPDIVYAVVSRARLLGTASVSGPEAARARVRTVSGGWLVLHGSILDDGRAAVIIEPARPPEMAPLIVDAYGLSERERDVTQLVVQGLSTTEIASTLFVSPYTVQDYLKAIFEKVGVRSRRELVATIFFQHYAPRMGVGDNLAASGWFRQ
jgi:DNA-binding CsgD family transcriptional regulator